MKSLSFEFAEPDVDISDVYIQMGYQGSDPGSEVTGTVEAILARISALCKPKAVCRIVEARVSPHGFIETDGEVLEVGKTIALSLLGPSRFCLFVVTAGTEFEGYCKELEREGDALKIFVADAIGSVIAENSVQLLADKVSDSENAERTNPYSPGYCGWGLREQEKLFRLTGPVEDECGVRLTESYLMLPVKSVSGIFGLGPGASRKPYGCAVCEQTDCYKKRR